VISINEETVVARRSRQGAGSTAARQIRALGLMRARLEGGSVQGAEQASRGEPGVARWGRGCSRAVAARGWLPGVAVGREWGEKRGRREIGNQRRERENRGERERG
jgi:hypothetical protein